MWEVSWTDLQSYLGGPSEGIGLTNSVNCRQADTFLCEDTDPGY